MKLALAMEFSTHSRNPDVLKALTDLGHEVLNIGVTGDPDGFPMNYVESAFVAAACWHLKACDFVIGGCGTGQGFCVALNQFPGMMCGHIEDPLDAWLFTQINGGNAVSLMYNKDYGWGAEHNLRFIFEKLFDQPIGSGYPKTRAELQTYLREALRNVATDGKRPMVDYIDIMPREMMENILKFPGFIDWVKDSKGGDEVLRARLIKEYEAL